ncbi:MAG: Cytochrome C553 (soluble cytochrome f) [uncultured Sulfurovum sp.]|uniref:Cytochrome C553 (Soluble cytochrome f) n=1 Tax=uncultured Sulfurovum sp. TaxID=269237 RepID=A0A6S6SHN0_9BACT|nr:MAG: Cytochrome C553 (soluble cytochrome f) [uncultured Sulfurovum sp.]
MKKLTVLSMIAAALLLTACGDSSTGAEAKAATETKTETEAPMKCGEGKCGDAMKKEAAAKCGGDTKSSADEAKDAVSNAAEKVKAAASEKATEAVDAVKEKAASAVDSVKETASSAVDSVKSAAASATAAVASAVNADAGKALYAKCAGCHGADGKTKAMGKANPVAGQSAADLEAHLHGYKDGTRNAHGMGMLMKGQVASMSDDDMKAVAAYMATL